MGRLVARSAPASRHPSAGLRSAQECPVEGREQERPHRCSQAVRAVVSEQAQPGVSRRAGHPNFEGTGAQLHSDDARFDAGDESAEGHLPKLGDCLRRQAGVCTALPCGMACEDRGSRRTPTCRTLLPAVRRLSGIAPASATRTISGSPETSGHEITAADSLDRPHPRRFVDRSAADPQSLPDQATTLGLLWIGAEDVHQWGISLRRWTSETTSSLSVGLRTVLCWIYFW